MASPINDGKESQNLRKIFLGGLNRTTTEDVLKDYFEQFGTVVDTVVITNTEKQSKGFGFVTMATIEETDKALRDKGCGPHNIEGKTVEVKRAIPRDSNIPAEPTKQVFVKNLGTVITEDQLRDYFSQFCKVKSAKVIKEKGAEQKSRGFGFVEFTDDFAHHAVDKVAIMESHTIDGRTIYCSKAEDRTNKDDGSYGRSYVTRGGMFGNRSPGRGYGYNDGYGGGGPGYPPYGGGRSGYGSPGYGGGPGYGGYYGNSGYGGSGYGGGGGGYGGYSGGYGGGSGYGGGGPYKY